MVELLTSESWVGGFCVTYFQLKWVAHSGPSVAFGIQAAIVAAASLAILATHIWGAKWRVQCEVPEPEN